VQNHQIENIITKALSGKLNTEEQTLLNNWISESEENEKEFNAYSELWAKSKKLVLTSSIDVESSLIQTKKQIAGLQPKKRWLIYLRQAAAVLFLSLTLSFLYNYYVQQNNTEFVPEQMVMQEIRAAYGTRTKIQLADGTNVWLNSGSTLRFPTSFQNTDERNVELNGEGYFDVTKNETKPFIVNTSKLNVKVYGTAFNVLAYNDHSSMTIALEEGKIGLFRNYSSGPKELMTLKPNDVVEYNSENNKLFHSSNLNMKKYTSWKDGYIVFFGDHIDNVVQKLEKWYNVDFEIKDSALKNYSFTATFVDESLEQVLQLLSLSSPINYKITPAKKQADNTFSKRKVTLSIKNN
jgi:ferric-dicitrate binding protein FerR (iron transport regulator)